MKAKASVVLVDDDTAFRQVLAGELERAGWTVTPAACGAEALRAVRDVEPPLVLLDLRLPDMSGLDVLKAIRERSPSSDVIVLTGHGSIDTAIESIRMGAFDYVAKPCPLDELEVRMERAMERQSLRNRANLLERGLTPPDVSQSFVGASPDFRRLLDLVDRVAPSESTVLITGETGAGKEMVAKLVHARSTRRHRPFVVVECAALQENLLQSELFGHERGAFTGADRAKAGLFEVAHGGTMFLDEIGEISQATQVKLLRVLDASTFRHVGGTSEIRVDVRVLAATNRDLPSMVAQGLFRQDLYYRLSTITLAVPPLRERRGDIDVLVAHFAAALNARFGVRKRIAPETLDRLRCHDWPGNVRELLHAIEAAMIVCGGDDVLPEHLPPALRQATGRGPGSATAEQDGPLPTLQVMERLHIERALRATAGHRGQAARMLGISERNLYRKLREYELLD
jgi:DNA-binding NtrC family response regulator